VLLCIGTSTAGFLYASDPARNSLLPDCLLFSRTGLYCAGCGLTRALHALLHGRVLEAVHDNALLVVLLPFVLYSLTVNAFRGWRANAWPTFGWHPGRVLRCSIGLFVAVAAFVILRNVPGAPFEWLRPIP